MDSVTVTNRTDQTLSPGPPHPARAGQSKARCSHYSALWAVADSFDDLQANPRPHPRSLLFSYELTLFFFPIRQAMPTTKSPGKRLLSDIGRFVRHLRFKYFNRLEGNLVVVHSQ